MPITTFTSQKAFDIEILKLIQNANGNPNNTIVYSYPSDSNSKNKSKPTRSREEHAKTNSHHSNIQILEQFKSHRNEYKSGEDIFFTFKLNKPLECKQKCIYLYKNEKTVNLQAKNVRVYEKAINANECMYTIKLKSAEVGKNNGDYNIKLLSRSTDKKSVFYSSPSIRVGVVFDEVKVLDSNWKSDITKKEGEFLDLYVRLNRTIRDINDIIFYKDNKKISSDQNVILSFENFISYGSNKTSEIKFKINKLTKSNSGRYQLCLISAKNKRTRKIDLEVTNLIVNQITSQKPSPKTITIEKATNEPEHFKKEDDNNFKEQKVDIKYDPPTTAYYKRDNLVFKGKENQQNEEKKLDAAYKQDIDFLMDQIVNHFKNAPFSQQSAYFNPEEMQQYQCMYGYQNLNALNQQYNQGMFYSQPIENNDQVLDQPQNEISYLNRNFQHEMENYENEQHPIVRSESSINEEISRILKEGRSDNRIREVTSNTSANFEDLQSLYDQDDYGNCISHDVFKNDDSYEKKENKYQIQLFKNDLKNTEEINVGEIMKNLGINPGIDDGDGSDSSSLNSDQNKDIVILIEIKTK